jgi:hypothetical protein
MRDERLRESKDELWKCDEALRPCHPDMLHRHRIPFHQSFTCNYTMTMSELVSHVPLTFDRRDYSRAVSSPEPAQESTGVVLAMHNISCHDRCRQPSMVLARKPQESHCKLSRSPPSSIFGMSHQYEIGCVLGAISGAEEHVADSVLPPTSAF